jgi:hypothetical protein
MPLLQPRIPVRSNPPRFSTRDHIVASQGTKRWWKSKRLWVFLVANVMQALGFFLPSLYLPAFASSLGLSGSTGSGLLACVNGPSPSLLLILRTNPPPSNIRHKPTNPRSPLRLNVPSHPRSLHYGSLISLGPHPLGSDFNLPRPSPHILPRPRSRSRRLDIPLLRPYSSLLPSLSNESMI